MLSDTILISPLTVYFFISTCPTCYSLLFNRFIIMTCSDRLYRWPGFQIPCSYLLHRNTPMTSTDNLNRIALLSRCFAMPSLPYCLVFKICMQWLLSLSYVFLFITHIYHRITVLNWNSCSSCILWLTIKTYSLLCKYLYATLVNPGQLYYNVVLNNFNNT